MPATTNADRPTCPRYTPWGDAQGPTREIIPGIFRVSTAGHGGYWLAPSRVAAIRAAFPSFNPWADYPWLEEDCDVSAAVLVFAPEFPAASVWSAVRSVRKDPTDYLGARAWLDSPAGADATRIADAFALEYADDWEAGGFGSDGDGYHLFLYRVGDGARRLVLIPRYPSQRFYTDAELSDFRDLPLDS